MGERSQESFINRKGRVLLLSLIAGAGFLTYTGYLFSLQIVKGFEYQDRARKVSQRMLPVPSQRGEIYDRNGDIPLATNIDSYAVDIIPAEVPKGEMESLKRELSILLSVPLEEFEKYLTPEMYHLYQPVEIADNISVEKIYFLAEHLDEYPGVTWHQKPIRSYLETGSIAHVIGYVNDITSGELQVLYNQGYKSGDVIGKRGIEKQYDELLRGEEGMRYRTVDVRGKGVDAGSETIIEPVPGKDIVLTIDSKIQKLCEEALGARVGAVVVLKPAT
ncbi:MAG: penicillin-binding protein 2, partial [Spirochaetales bacterium]|nr:penicillin-binding protein 2 [Spirochaetales bacterium]